MSGDVQPEASGRPPTELIHPGVRPVAGEAIAVDPHGSLLIGRRPRPHDHALAASLPPARQLFATEWFTTMLTGEVG